MDAFSLTGTEYKVLHGHSGSVLGVGVNLKNKTKIYNFHMPNIKLKREVPESGSCCSILFAFSLISQL